MSFRRPARAVALLLPCLLAALLAAATLGAAAPLGAETPCEARLREADAAYRAGRFAEALAAASACLAAKPSAKEREQALAAKARIHLAADEVAAARQAVQDLLRANPDFAANLVSDPPRFLRLLAEVRRDSATVEVSSVSKTRESLREAPATVVVVTAEEIERRGYHDLEALLDDLPGFDVSRTNGWTYSNAYQRGYRSDETNRTLVLVDGVEENDLWSGTVYLSRQYPLSNVQQVEVIYGPASTIYGANAFAGVIHILTKDARKLIPEGRNWGVKATVAGGSAGTGYLDSTVAGRLGSTLNFTLTGRLYRSDEQDLSGFPDWDYDPGVYRSADFATVYRDHLQASGAEAARLIADHPEIASSPFFDVTGTGNATVIRLNESGLARAAELDGAALSQHLGGVPIGYSDPTRAWLVNAKLEAPHLVIGVQSWRDQEGGGAISTDQRRPGADNGNRWTPEQLWLYGKYSWPVSRELSFSLFGQYKQHALDPADTVISGVGNYARGSLGIDDLAREVAPSWSSTFFYLSNTQLRTEATAVYRRSERWDLVGGVEYRSSSIQGDYLISGLPDPDEEGAPETTIPGGNSFTNRDLGLFAQLSVRPASDWKLVVAGRVDNNRIRSEGGYGTVFNPRLAAIWSPGPWVFKAIYAEAFQDISNFQKYATVPGDRELPNPGLAPERVENLELAAGWQREEKFSVDVAAYEARYSDVVQSVPGVPCGPPFCDPPGLTRQFQGIGALRIRGVQASAVWRLPRATLSGNYTWADPWNEGSGKRIGDIATHRLNLGLATRLAERFDLDLRGGYVGERPTGAETDAANNPLSEIDAYTVVDAALTWREVVPHAALQLVVDNVLDGLFYHPGVREADGIGFASQVPQPGRTFTLRLLTSY